MPSQGGIAATTSASPRPLPADSVTPCSSLPMSRPAPFRPLEMCPCRLEHGEEHLLVFVRSTMTSHSFFLTSAAWLLLYHTRNGVPRAGDVEAYGRPARQILS